MSIIYFFLSSPVVFTINIKVLSVINKISIHNLYCKTCNVICCNVKTKILNSNHPCANTIKSSKKNVPFLMDMVLYWPCPAVVLPTTYFCKESEQNNCDNYFNFKYFHWKQQKTRFTNLNNREKFSKLFHTFQCFFSGCLLHILTMATLSNQKYK